MSRFKIYRIDPAKHLDILKSLHVDTLGSFPLYHFTRAGTAWWLVWDTLDKVYVGFAGARRLPEPDNTRVYLCRSGILHCARGHGLQKKLILKRVAWAKSEGCTAVITDTAPENIWSANNLIAAGFKMFRPNSYWASRAAIYFYRKP